MDGQDNQGECQPSPVSCFTCQASKKAEWCALNDEDIEFLNRVKVPNLYKTGQVIFYQGNPCLGLFCVESGELALRNTSEGGHESIVRLVHANQTLGYRTYFAGSKYSATAVALSDCQICFIERQAVDELLTRNPVLGLGFLRRATRELEEAEQARVGNVSLPVRTRLAHLLLTLKDRRGTVDDEGRLIIDLPLSRKDVAALLDARPETISRTIKALESDGVASFDGRQVVVPDLDALLDEIELPAES